MSNTNSPVWVKVDGLYTELPYETEISDSFQVSFGGLYQMEVSNVNSEYKVTNAMSGWGNSCIDEFINSEVKILTEQQSPQPERTKEIWDKHSMEKTRVDDWFVMRRADF